MPPHQRQQEDLAQDAVADDAEADKDESGGDGDRAVLENQQVFWIWRTTLATRATRLAQTSPMPAKTCPATTFGVSSDLTISIPQTMPIRAQMMGMANKRATMPPLNA